MGVRSGQEIGRQRVTKALTTAGTTPATGISDTFYPMTDARAAYGGRFNFSLSGTFVATVVVEKTFDGGTTWQAATDEFGTVISLTAAGAKTLRELESGVGYRARASAYTSGTANARFSQ